MDEHTVFTDQKIKGWGAMGEGVALASFISTYANKINKNVSKFSPLNGIMTYYYLYDTCLNKLHFSLSMYAHFLPDVA